MTLRQTQPLPYVPLNDQDPNFLSAWRRRKFGFYEVTFWTKEAFKLKTGSYPVAPDKGEFNQNPAFKGESYWGESHV